MVPVSMIKVYELICDISGVKLNSLSVNSLFLFMLVYIDSTEGLLYSGRVYIQEGFIFKLLAIIVLHPSNYQLIKYLVINVYLIHSPR